MKEGNPEGLKAGGIPSLFPGFLPFEQDRTVKKNRSDTEIGSGVKVDIFRQLCYDAP